VVETRVAVIIGVGDGANPLGLTTVKYKIAPTRATRIHKQSKITMAMIIPVIIPVFFPPGVSAELYEVVMLSSFSSRIDRLALPQVNEYDCQKLNGGVFPLHCFYPQPANRHQPSQDHPTAYR
jgi:hypothetical protein